MKLFDLFMAKKVVKEEEVSFVCTVSDSRGNEVQKFTDVQEAYTFASENGYQVNVTV